MNLELDFDDGYKDGQAFEQKMTFDVLVMPRPRERP